MLNGPWKRIVPIYALAVLAYMSVGMLGPLAADLRVALGTSTQAVGLAIGLPFLPFLLGGTLLGWMVDRFGVRNVSLFGIGLMVLAALSHVFAQNLAWLMANTFVQGLGMLAAVVGGQTALAKETTDKIQVKALALFATSPIVGSSLGTLLAAHLAGGAHWRLTFIIYAALGVCMALTTLLSFASHTTHGQPAHAAYNVRVLLKERSVITLAIGFAFVTMTAIGSSSVWPLYLSNAHHVSIKTTGTLSALATLTGILGSFITGALLSRAVPASRIVPVLVSGAIASTIVVYAMHAGLVVTLAAMTVWNIVGSATVALIFAVLPRVVLDKSRIGASTGLMHQLNCIGAVGGAPVFFAILASEHPGITFIAVITACWLIMAVTTPARRLKRVSQIASVQQRA
jgi:predicted MFS family arabinose efflux permease